MIAIVDPPGKPTPLWWAKAMPPLGQYFRQTRGSTLYPAIRAEL
jgi:hypothetical protein